MTSRVDGSNVRCGRRNCLYSAFGLDNKVRAVPHLRGFKASISIKTTWIPQLAGLSERSARAASNSLLRFFEVSMMHSRSLLSVLLRGRSLLAFALTLAFLAVSVLPSFAAGGQKGNINGQIVDNTSGAPVANARISVSAPAGRYEATTDSQGRFSLLGVDADTYTISVEAQGYTPFSQSGVTVIGDQNLTVGSLRISKQLRTIARTTTRSIASAFQPNQTVDSVTVNSGRITQTTGKAASTNENALLLSVPGATLDAGGNITIRGSLENEVGYQLDGIPFTEPFFSTNGSSNRFSGLSSVQVVEGAGDATQGNVGGGVVNLIPKRGTYPPFGMLDAEVGTPGQYNQGAIEYGLASQSGNVSNYLSYLQTNRRLLYGLATTGAAPYGSGNFYNNTRDVNTDLIDNFVLKFGKSLNQSFQVLYENRRLAAYGPYGGVSYTGASPTAFFQTDPYQYGPLGLTAPLNNNAGLLASIFPTLQGQASVNQPPPSEQAQIDDETQALKFEYDNQLNSSNFIDLKLYNFDFAKANTDTIGQGGQDPATAVIGGRRSGLIGDFIHQFTPNYTFTFRVEGENQHPMWDGFNPYNLAQLLTGNPGVLAADGVTVLPDTPGSGAAPSLADFVNPVGGVCPVANGCYLSQFFRAGNIPKVPISGINYNQALFQTFAFAIRNQINIRDRLRLDLGARYDEANYKFGPNPFNTNPQDLNNPSDVPSSALANKYINPRTVDPRAAVSYQMGRNDSLRFGYGRSTTFLNAQTAGTPASLYNAEALQHIPALDTAAAPACGSGTNPAAARFKCANYAQQLYWLYDQNFDAPDLGGATAQVASNYDITYQHQFRNGFGMRVTPFYKLSSGLPSFALLSETTDAITGAILTEVFTSNNSGLNRTTGVEFGLTTPERPVGFDGFFSATYQNVLTSAPPLINGEANLPIIGSGSLALGDVYRAGYVSPFVARLGVEYKTKFGLRLNPILQYDRGFPFNVGDLIASRSAIFGAFQNIPQVNVGPGRTLIPGFNGATGGSLSTNYVDPAMPGSVFKPNIAATRGTPESASAGGILYHPDLEADMTVEYKAGRNTFGVQATNLFGNVYNGVVPGVNPYYQPVATGVAGPQTSQVKQAVPDFQGGIYNNRGFANVPADANAYTNAAYLLSPSNPTRFNFYYQLAL